MRNVGKQKEEKTDKYGLYIKKANFYKEISMQNETRRLQLLSYLKGRQKNNCSQYEARNDETIKELKEAVRAIRAPGTKTLFQE